jgi:hypothetical protein
VGVATSVIGTGGFFVLASALFGVLLGGDVVDHSSTDIQHTNDGEDDHFHASVDYAFETDPLGGAVLARSIDPRSSTLSREGPWSMLAIVATGFGIGVVSLLAGIGSSSRVQHFREAQIEPNEVTTAEGRCKCRVLAAPLPLPSSAFAAAISFADRETKRLGEN